MCNIHEFGVAGDKMQLRFWPSITTEAGVQHRLWELALPAYTHGLRYKIMIKILLSRPDVASLA